jgi:hypothetical protein
MGYHPDTICEVGHAFHVGGVANLFEQMRGLYRSRALALLHLRCSCVALRRFWGERGDEFAGTYSEHSGIRGLIDGTAERPRVSTPHTGAREGGLPPRSATRTRGPPKVKPCNC